MAKKAANPYWVKRSEFDMIQVERTAESVAARLEVAYSNSVSDLQKELDAFFGKYAKDNEITFAQAKERLNPKQLKSYRQEHNRYIRKAEKYGNDLKDLLKGSPEYKCLEKELKELSSRAYVTKLDELIGKTKMQINLTGLEETSEMYKSISQQYLDSYYKEVFNMSDIIQSDFAAPSMKVAKKAAMQKWYSEQNFSDRIWKDKEKLTRELEQLLPRTFITDSKKQSASEIISERMGVSLSNAKRLVKTEMSHIANQACLDSYKDMEVEQFQFLATLDGKTSEACRSLDYEVFDLKDAETGVNVPPIHPYCRSTTIPYFEPDDLDIFVGEGRAARNKEGKTVIVSDKSNYQQWAKVAAPDLLKPKKEEAVQKPLNLIEDLLTRTIEEEEADRVPIKKLEKELTENEIVEKIAGGDLTSGSCVSVAFAYAANRFGLDVGDFRGGKEAEFFARYGRRMIDFDNVRGITSLLDDYVRTDFSSFNDDYEVWAGDFLNKNIKKGKEYILFIGRHASVVRNSNIGLEYLELQSSEYNGWHPFVDKIKRKNEVYTLKTRFGLDEHSVTGRGAVLMELDSLKENETFVDLLEYVNTPSSYQQKGSEGYEK